MSGAKISDYEIDVKDEPPVNNIDQTFGIVDHEDSKMVTSEPVSEDVNDHRMEPKEITDDYKLSNDYLDEKICKKDIRDDLQMKSRQKNKKNL